MTDGMGRDAERLGVPGLGPALQRLQALMEEAPWTQVACSSTRCWTRQDLVGDLAKVQAMAKPGESWLLAAEDPYVFLAGLLGLAAAGAHIVLPPNHLSDSLAALERGVAGTLRALPESGSTSMPSPRVFQDVDLVFWTSGSSGQAKAVRRRLTHLLAEVGVLEGLFGQRFLEGPVLGTVPHHHIYGCLFRVLWPFLMGRAFAREISGHPDHFAQDHGALVSSPAHLSRILHLVDFHGITRPVATVFSSGGPLARRDALAWRAWVPGGVVEVYGSTESGGIAWRVQDEDPASEAWTPFPDVQLAQDEDGALRLHTERVEGGALRMEDRVEFRADGRFELLGRLDRVVKVEEKRVSLPELERALEEHPKVRKAAVLLLEGPRRMLGAVVALDQPPGSPKERRALAQVLRSHLGARFDSVLLPRRWRFLEQLPTDARGKLPQVSLKALFAESQP